LANFSLLANSQPSMVSSSHGMQAGVANSHRSRLPIVPLRLPRRGRLRRRTRDRLSPPL